MSCYLSTVPNEWGYHDPQCNDSTWDHECPVGPCDLPEHGNKRSEPDDEDDE